MLKLAHCTGAVSFVGTASSQDASKALYCPFSLGIFDNTLVQRMLRMVADGTDFDYLLSNISKLEVTINEMPVSSPAYGVRLVWSLRIHYAQRLNSLQQRHLKRWRDLCLAAE